MSKAKELIESLDEVKIKEAIGLDRFISKQYKDYEGGDPIGAAKELKKVISKVDKLLSGVGKILDKAGPFLSPAMRKELAFEMDAVKSLRVDNVALALTPMITPDGNIVQRFKK